MVKDGLATTNPDLGTGSFDNLLGIQSGSHAMAFDTSAALGTISSVLAAAAARRTSSSGSRRSPPGPEARAASLVSGGALYMVNKSAPDEAGGGVEVPEVPRRPENMTTWAIGTGYLPILQGLGGQPRDAAVLGSRTRSTRSRTTSCSTVRRTWRPSGSVIGNYTGARDALRDAENSMFLNGAGRRPR